MPKKSKVTARDLARQERERAKSAEDRARRAERLKQAEQAAAVKPPAKSSP